LSNVCFFIGLNPFFLLRIIVIIDWDDR
jgi:hypothetical protein